MGIRIVKANEGCDRYTIDESSSQKLCRNGPHFDNAVSCKKVHTLEQVQPFFTSFEF